MGGRKVPEEQRREQLLLAAYRVGVRDGLDAVTARAVAAEAGTSPGLVFFHFGSKDGLLSALLDTLLAGALDAVVTPEIAALPTAAQRLETLLRIELEGLPEQREAVELFFTFWLAFGRREDFRARIERALLDYRGVFLPVCADVVAEQHGLGGADADSLADLVLAVIEGAAVHVVREPQRFSPETLLAAVRAVSRPMLAAR